MLVRSFTQEDAEILSRLIIQNLRHVNIRDYSTEVIEALVPSYMPDNLIRKSISYRMIVCLHGNDLTGTASLDVDRVRHVFVDMDKHRKGIGRLLMNHIEVHALMNDLKRIYLHSGLAAQGFYERLGFEAIEKIESELNGIPFQMIKMQKELSKVVE